MELKANSKNVSLGVKIGILTVSAYLANYVLRSLLSTATPYMLQDNYYSKEFIGLISSVCFISYAFGQLLNGFLGERIKPKYMIGIGLCVSGMSAFLFPLFKNEAAAVILFGIMGFGMSMLRGPLMKIISENTAPKAARMICTIFSITAFVGPFIVSALIIVFTWDIVFISTGIFVVLYGIGLYIVIEIFSKKGFIKTWQQPENKKISAEFKELFKVDHFVYYMIVAGLVEISTSSISFWVPTYFTEFLGINPDVSIILSSIISFLRALTPFASLYLFKILNGNDIKINYISYIISAVGFLILAFIKTPWLNILLFILALLAVTCSGNILWSIYIPSLAKTGKTSTANGILDFTGYACAAVANIFFGNAVELIGWRNLIFVWFSIMAVGILLSFAEKKKICRPITEE